MKGYIADIGNQAEPKTFLADSGNIEGKPADPCIKSDGAIERSQGRVVRWDGFGGRKVGVQLAGFRLEMNDAECFGGRAIEIMDDRNSSPAPSLMQNWAIRGRGAR